ncbi:hypothetical protein ABTN43_19585, partial [Acinetobacter baumannii]
MTSQRHRIGDASQERGILLACPKVQIQRLKEGTSESPDRLKLICKQNKGGPGRILPALYDWRCFLG